jgi:L-aspartate oxidase
MTNRIDRFGQEPVIVVGSGIAGLLLAIELADEGCRVVLVTKGRLEESNTAWAQGGLAAVTGLNAADSKEQHLADTIAAGDGLSDRVVAERIIADGAALVQRLAHHGVEFDPTSLALEGGHRLARVLHSADATGRAIIDALISTVKKHKLIRVMESCILQKILVENNRACGILVIDLGSEQEPAPIDPESVAANATVSGSFERRTGSLANSPRTFVVEGRAVVLATGGLGQVYARTTNPGTATGDGIIAAYQAGAHLADLEFVQFHPTALHLPGAPAFLISEAARGAGAVLLNKEGDRFLHKYHPSAELATRDIVSRAIFTNMQEERTDHVWLDMRSIGEEKLLKLFPNIVARLRTFGIDPLTAPVPVSPAAHYFMGGILSDEAGRTTLDGLFAIGECASTGLHGANRLASNSLLEGGVMALKLARVLSNKFDRAGRRPLDVKLLGLKTAVTREKNVEKEKRGTSDDDMVRFERFDGEQLRHDLLTAAGLVRSEQSLITLLNKYSESPSTMLSLLIARSALLRNESRGAHWRQDYPTKNDGQFRARQVVDKNGSQWMKITGTAPGVLPVPAASRG